ncbi:MULTISPECIES: hypothetical protein [unclassified Microcoleus]|uniref:hypothetical protein n=1 Tax=unclassified Microcoleus TaxID=2642155 RepID=UPI002FD72EC6
MRAIAQLQLPLRIYTLFLTEPRPIRQLSNLLFGPTVDRPSEVALVGTGLF